MRSIEALEKYLSGEVGRKSTRLFFESLEIGDDLRQHVKNHVCYSFFLRYTMYREGLVSERELVLKLRELILYVGRIRCGEALKRIVLEYGTEYGLFCQEETYVNATLKLPNWFYRDESFVKNIYSLSKNSVDGQKYKIGDSLLAYATERYPFYKSFELKTAVHTALSLQDRRTLLISLQTGAGKSLITQMLAVHSNGLTIVAVPTVALAIDQYTSARRTLKQEFQSTIFYYRSDQSQEEYAQIIDAIKNQTARLLFISPEALLKNVYLNSLLEESVDNQYLKNIVIDEAHIVPDWGILFRPDFQLLSIVLKKWRIKEDAKIRTYLLSATVSDHDVEILKDLFSPDDELIEYRCDSLRLEPQFCYYGYNHYSERNDRLEEAIEYLPKPMIVYFIFPQDAIAYHQRLRKKGYKNVGLFHGETRDEDRRKILEDWKDEIYDVILATSAFGIGVDKSNVRTVIHACLPENLSRFYQEVGRAGRDGFPSLSVLMPYNGMDKDDRSDSKKAHSLVKGRVLRVETMVNRWEGLKEKAVVNGNIMTIDTSAVPTHFSEEDAAVAGEQNSVWNINFLLFLHRNHFIEIIDLDFQVESRSYIFTVRVIDAHAFTNSDTMKVALSQPRENELAAQLNGYSTMRRLILAPTKNCWGQHFQKLYPYSYSCCNGCPKHPDGVPNRDVNYKIRKRISFIKQAAPLSRNLYFAMRNNQYMIVRNPIFPQIDKSSLVTTANKLNQSGIMCLVANGQVLAELDFCGLKLTPEEFRYVADYIPTLASFGVFAVFGGSMPENDLIFSSISKLSVHQYKFALYCSDSMYIPSMRRQITDFVDCRIRNEDELK